MWLTFNRRLYWHKGWACGLQISFILGWSPACLSHLLPLWPWVSFLTSLSIRFLRGGREGGHMGTGRFKQDNGGKAFWDVLWHRESTRWSDHYLNHRYISFFSYEAGMREGGDADFANLTVFQSPPTPPRFGKSCHFETTESRNTFQPHHLPSSSGPRARYQAGWSSKFIFFKKESILWWGEKYLHKRAEKKGSDVWSRPSGLKWNKEILCYPGLRMEQRAGLNSASDVCFGEAKSSLSHAVSMPISYCQTWLVWLRWWEGLLSPLGNESTLSQRNGSCWRTLIPVIEPRSHQGLDQKATEMKKKKKKKTLKSLQDKTIFLTWNSILGPIGIKFKGKPHFFCCVRILSFQILSPLRSGMQRFSSLRHRQIWVLTVPGRNWIQ